MTREEHEDSITDAALALAQAINAASEDGYETFLVWAPYRVISEPFERIVPSVEVLTPTIKPDVADCDIRQGGE